MYYICVENNVVSSIVNYRPNVPANVTLVEISDEQYALLNDNTHVFDPINLVIIPQDPAFFTNKEIEKENAAKQEYLRSTDWMILRHVRETALGLETSLSADKYLQLEQMRQDVAASIVKQDQ
mgnify:CR=1 FL=1